MGAKDLEQESETIGLHKYTVTKMGAKQGSRALTRIINSPNPVEWSEADMDHFCDLFAAQTVVSGGNYGGMVSLESVFDDHFKDNYYELLKWLGFCVKAHFGRFFEMAALEAAAKMAAAEKAKSENASKENA
jgi:hypothetical protein